MAGLLAQLSKVLPVEEAIAKFNQISDWLKWAVDSGKMPQYTADDVINGNISIAPDARAARRIGQGFVDDPMYRGQIGDDLLDQTWWTNNPDIANTYVNKNEGGKLKKAYINRGDTATIYPDSDQWNRIGAESYIQSGKNGEYEPLFDFVTGKPANEFDLTNTNKLAEWSKYADLDTLNIKGLRDVGPYNAGDVPWDLPRSDVMIVNKPENVRGVNAIFDPRNVGKNYELGSRMMPTGATGLIGMNELQAQQELEGLMGQYNQFMDRKPDIYNYGDIAPIKRNVVTGEYSAAVPKVVDEIVKGLLDIGQSRKTGVVNNPTSIWDVLL